MSETKKRTTIRIGIVTGQQVIDENNAVVADYIVNTWGGSYMRLEPEEAVEIQRRLNDVLADDMLALQKKAQAAMVDLGVEWVLGGKPADGKKRTIGDNAGRR